jgi:hypothetical protein
MLQMKRLICCLAAVTIANGCSAESIEQSFFDKPPQSRVERLRNYSLEDQYRIFRYGNDRIEPPVMELAKPIAERGKTAIPFLHAQLRGATDDQTIRDILLIFETMTRLRTYDLQSNRPLMNDVRSKVSYLKDRPWGETCRKMLRRIETSE